MCFHLCPCSRWDTFFFAPCHPINDWWVCSCDIVVWLKSFYHQTWIKIKMECFNICAPNRIIGSFAGEGLVIYYPYPTVDIQPQTWPKQWGKKALVVWVILCHFEELYYGLLFNCSRNGYAPKNQKKEIPGNLFNHTNHVITRWPWSIWETDWPAKSTLATRRRKVSISDAARQLWGINENCPKTWRWLFKETNHPDVCWYFLGGSMDPNSKIMNL